MIFDKLRSRNGHPSDAELVARIYKALRSYGPLYATKSPIQVEVNEGVAIWGTLLYSTAPPVNPLKYWAFHHFYLPSVKEHLEQRSVVHPTQAVLKSP